MPLPLRRRLAFATVLCTLAVGAVEGGARVLPDRLVAPREDVVREFAGGKGLVYGGDIPGWDIDPNGGEQWDTTYHTNQWRMRGPDYPDEKGPNVKRVIFVGDSSIFGVLLDWEETFAARFEAAREARDPGTDWQVANCASPGHSTEQSLRKLKRHCLPFQPDYVVIGNQFSDSTRESVTDVERFGLSADLGFSRALEQSAAYRLFRNAWIRARGVDEAPREIAQVGVTENGTVRRVPPKDYEANLRRMVELVRQADARPVFLLLAAQDDLVAGADVPSAPYRDAMRRVAQEEEIPLADAPPRFQVLPRAKGVFEDPVHPGPLGALTLGLLLNETIPG